MYGCHVTHEKPLSSLNSFGYTMLLLGKITSGAGDGVGVETVTETGAGELPATPFTRNSVPPEPTGVTTIVAVLPDGEMLAVATVVLGPGLILNAHPLVGQPDLRRQTCT